MFKEFNVKFEDVEMIGGADNILEDTEVTKVIVRGDSKMSSLDSAFKNCPQLDTIDGQIDLNGVSDIDNMLENSEFVKKISLKNINNEDMSINNPFPSIEEISIGGELYTKAAIQNVVASKDWTFDNIKYVDTIGKKVYEKSGEAIDENDIVINDPLEQKATEFEIIGQTYENLTDGKGEQVLIDELIIEAIDGNPTEFSPHIEQPICIESIEGETYQNLVDGKGEHKLTDPYKINSSEFDGFENMPTMVEIPEIYGNTVQGYVSLISNQQLADAANSITWVSAYAAKNPLIHVYEDDGTFKFNDYCGSGDNVVLQDIANSPNATPIKLKAKTTYTVALKNSAHTTFMVYSRTARLGGHVFTTDSTGEVFIFGQALHVGKNNILLIEGNDPSLPGSGEFNLNSLESVGTLYTDEEGSPILDDKGNEQYKLDIEHYTNGNLFEGSKETISFNKTTFDRDEEGNFVYNSPAYDGYYAYDLTTGEAFKSVTGNFNQEMKSSKYIISGAGDYCITYRPVQNNTGMRLTTFCAIVDDNRYIAPTAFNGDRECTIKVNCKKGIKRIMFNEWYSGDVRENVKFNITVNKGTNPIPYEKFKKINKTTLLMPYKLCRMASGADTANQKVKYATDKIYWDYNTKKYYLEKNIAYHNTGTVKYEGGWGDISGILKMPVGTWSRFTSGTYKGVTYSPIWVQGCLKSGWHPSCPYPNSMAIAVYSSGATRFATYPGETWDNERVSNYLSNKMVYYIMSEPEIIELSALEPITLETYSSTNYIYVNSDAQASEMIITNKKVMFTPELQANKDYTLQLDSTGKNDKSITVNLGGTETTIQPVNDTNEHHKVVIRTPGTLVNNSLELSGEGVIVNDIMLFDGGENVIKQNVEYIDGIQSMGKPQEDNSYKIDILMGNEWQKIWEEM